MVGFFELDRLMQRAESDIAQSTRQWHRDQRWMIAQHYRRTKLLTRYLPPRLYHDARNSDDPKVTWCVIRELCRRIRYLERAGCLMGHDALIRVNTARHLAAGEIMLLHKQRKRRAA